MQAMEILNYNISSNFLDEHRKVSYMFYIEVDTMTLEYKGVRCRLINLDKSVPAANTPCITSFHDSVLHVYYAERILIMIPATEAFVRKITSLSPFQAKLFYTQVSGQFSALPFLTRSVAKKRFQILSRTLYSRLSRVIRSFTQFNSNSLVRFVLST